MGIDQVPIFNPCDDKYKKVEDLPQEEQKNFANVEGGFIRQKAKDFENASLADEKLRNPKVFGGNFFDRISGSKKVKKLSTAEIIQGRITKTVKDCKEGEQVWKRYEELRLGGDPIAVEKKIISDKAALEAATRQSTLAETESSAKRAKEDTL